MNNVWVWSYVILPYKWTWGQKCKQWVSYEFQRWIENWRLNANAIAFFIPILIPFCSILFTSAANRILNNHFGYLEIWINFLGWKTTPIPHFITRETQTIIISDLFYSTGKLMTMKVVKVLLLVRCTSGWLAGSIDEKRQNKNIIHALNAKLKFNWTKHACWIQYTQSPFPKWRKKNWKQLSTIYHLSNLNNQKKPEAPANQKRV